MRIIQFFLLISILSAFSACKGGDAVKLPEAVSDYLANKSVEKIKIFNTEAWFLSTRVCDTCSTPTEQGVVPLIMQLSRLKDKKFRFDEASHFTIPVPDWGGWLHTAKPNEILLINDFGSYTPVVNTGDFIINQFVFDNNNHIWMTGNKGIACWNGTELTLFDAANSLLTTKATHGITVDRAGTVWIALDFWSGLLKITNGKWEAIPYPQPPIAENLYLSNPLADHAGRIWLTAVSISSGAHIVRYDGKSWSSDLSASAKSSTLFLDSKGRIWQLSYTGDTPTLRFFENEKWNDFDIRDIESPILSLDADRTTIFIGTTTGVVVKKW